VVPGADRRELALAVGGFGAIAGAGMKKGGTVAVSP
jgi:hypothetical protein